MFKPDPVASASESVEDLQKWAVAIIQILQKVTVRMRQPMVFSLIKEYGRDPFLVLMSGLLSLRAKDTATLTVSRALFARGKTPEQLLALSPEELEHLFYPIGFYRRKVQQVHHVSQELIERFNGQVPQNMADLLSIKGIGRKTANLVLSVGFGIPAICVDTHVHRISNRLGLVKTVTVEQTEYELKKILPKEYWSECNRLLVIWGQNICVPISPRCSECAINALCKRVGVNLSR